MKRPRTAALAVVFLFHPALPRAEPFIAESAGKVEVRRMGGGWLPVERPPQALSAGDGVRTGSRARATLLFDDGSRVELGADADFSLDGAGAGGATMRVTLGTLKAFVNKLLAGRFEVRTPTAVCSVRGTEFQVQVLSGGRTTVELYKGLLGVEDNRGNQTLLRPDERLTIDLRGMEVPRRRPSKAQERRSEFRFQAKGEAALDMTKQQLQAAAAREIKLSEFQQGKSLIDVNGERVRLEQYILRPQPNQFKLVVLNERRGRFDFFFYLGAFNQALPPDLGAALRQLPGCAGAQCPYFLTDFQTGRSNMKDTIYEHGMNTMGAQVDVNHNGVPGDKVFFLFDPAVDGFVDVSNQAVFQTLFNKYGFYVNGKLMRGWSGANIASYTNVADAAMADPVTGAPLTAANAWLDPKTGQLVTRNAVNVTFPDPDKVHQRVYESYSDGSFIQWDNYIVSNGGKIAPMADFSGITSGAALRKKILDYNYEQVVTSSQFSGRKIDLAVEPKVFVESGLIQ